MYMYMYMYMYIHSLCTLYIIGPPREQLRQLQQYANTNQPAEEMSSVMGLMGMPVRGVCCTFVYVMFNIRYMYMYMKYMYSLLYV